MTAVTAAHATNYNVLVFGDFSGQNSDVEGAMAAAGNITLTNYGVGANLTSSDNSSNTLVAGGKLTANSGQLYHGNAVASNLAVSPSFNVLNGTASTGTPVNFNALKSQYDGYSTSFGGETANGTTSLQYGGLTLTGSSSSLNVFDVDLSSVGSLNNFTLNIPSGSLALINVKGSSASFSNMGFNVNGTSASNILFNFTNATSLTLGGIGFEGSILAPYANVSFDNGHQDGQLIGKSFTGGGQINLFLPNSSFFLGITATPEPAAWMMLIIGFGGVGAMLRRKPYQQLRAA